MERRFVIRSAGVAGVAGLLAACGKKEEGAAAPAATGAPAVTDSGQIRWRMASSFPKSLDTIYGAGEVFARKVGEMSGGRFQISVHAGGELVPPFGIVDGVQAGTIEMGHTVPYYFFGKNEAFAIGAAIPFGMNSRQTTAWMMHGGGRQLMNEFYGQYNIVSFAGGNTGAQMGGWFRKEIKTPADIRGLKFRVGGFAGRVIERMGGVPQNIPGGEIYQSLEKGTIDAAEWVGPYDDLKLGFVKVAPYYYYPGWWEGGPEVDFFINTTAYNGLSAEYKAIVDAASAYTHMDMQAKYDALNPGALKQLVQAGARVTPFPQSVLTASFNASMELYAELDARNPDWKKIYGSYREFQRDQILWFRFAEARFDAFMQTAKL